jgi:maltose O-acetyltransferase
MPLNKVKIARYISRIFIAYFKLRYRKKVKFGKNIIINHRFKISGKGQLIIGDNCNLWAHCEPNSFHFYDENAKVTIGEGNRLNGLTCHCAQSIEIKNDCLIGSAIIMDTDFHTFDDPNHILYGKEKNKPVKVGNKVWICGQSVILKGIVIGDSSVVGFRSVVTKSFAADLVVAGNPAKIVKQK